MSRASTMKRLAPTLLVAAAIASPCPALAQDSWAVLVATTRPGDVRRAMETADHSAAALEASAGGVISTERAIARVETALSEPFRPAPAELARRVGAAAESVLEDVAFGRNQESLDVGQPILAELDAHLASIGRDDQVAADVANLCLYLVRAHAQRRDAEAAREQVRTCLRLVPDLGADARLHPPAVRDLLAAARRELEEGAGGILAIHAAPVDREGCAIRVNGRRVGATPWARVPVVPGPYAVQIECDEGRAGRVHPVQVEVGAPTRVTIRARLAEALATRPAIALAYSDRAELAAHLADDVEVLAEALGATRVLVAVDDGRSLVVRAFARSPEGTRVLGSASVPEPVDDVRSREAVAAALAGRRDESTADPLESASAPRSGGGGEVASIVLGSLLAAAGVAGLGVAWGYWAELEARHREYAALTDTSIVGNDRFLPLKNELETFAWTVLGAGTAGGLLLTLGAPFLLPQVDEYPWWSVVIGAGGAALIAVGAWLPSQERTIGPSGQPRGDDTEILGGLLIAHGVPLLSVPLVYLVREATRDPRATATVQVDSTGLVVRVGSQL